MLLIGQQQSTVRTIQNEMPFVRDTRVVSSNIVLDRGPGLSTGRGDIWVETPVHSNDAYHQITVIYFWII